MEIKNKNKSWHKFFLYLFVWFWRFNFWFYWKYFYSRYIKAFPLPFSGSGVLQEIFQRQSTLTINSHHRSVAAELLLACENFILVKTVQLLMNRKKKTTDIQRQIFTENCRTFLKSKRLLWFTQAQGTGFHFQSL